MKPGAYISELLFKHDAVLLPGFGTFTTRYMSAKFIPEKKIVQAPAKIIDFRTEPKRGETPLIDLIAEREGKSKEEAIKYLNDFVRDSENALDAGERVEIEMIGTFSKDTAGNTRFEPNKEINYMMHDTGIPKVRVPEQKPIDHDAILTSGESDKQPLTQPEGSSDIVSSDEDSKEFSEYVSEQDTREDSKEDSTEDTKEASAYSTDITKPKTHEAMTDPKKKESKALNTLPPALKWAAIILIPLLVILIILFLNFNFFFGQDGLFRRSEPLVVEKPVEAPAEVAPVDVIDDIVIEEDHMVPDPEEVPVFDPYADPPKPLQDRPVYYIIVGSFKNVNKAESLALKLRKEGNELAGVMDITLSGFNRTYSGFYYNLREAEAKKEQLSDDLREIAWILHR